MNIFRTSEPTEITSLEQLHDLDNSARLSVQKNKEGKSILVATKGTISDKFYRIWARWCSNQAHDHNVVIINALKTTLLKDYSKAEQAIFANQLLAHDTYKNSKPLMISSIKVAQVSDLLKKIATTKVDDKDSDTSPLLKDSLQELQTEENFNEKFQDFLNGNPQVPLTTIKQFVRHYGQTPFENKASLEKLKKPLEKMEKWHQQYRGLQLLEMENLGRLNNQPSSLSTEEKLAIKNELTKIQDALETLEESENGNSHRELAQRFEELNQSIKNATTHLENEKARSNSIEIGGAQRDLKNKMSHKEDFVAEYPEFEFFIESSDKNQSTIDETCKTAAHLLLNPLLSDENQSKNIVIHEIAVDPLLNPLPSNVASASA